MGVVRRQADIVDTRRRREMLRRVHASSRQRNTGVDNVLPMRYARNEGRELTWRFRFIVTPRQKSIVQVLQRGSECLKGPQKNNREQGQMAANRSRKLPPNRTLCLTGPQRTV